MTQTLSTSTPSFPPPRDIVFLVGRDVERDRGRGADWAKRPRQNGGQLHGSSVYTYTGATKTQLLSILTDGGINIWNESGWSPIGRTRFLTSASEWPDRFAFEMFWPITRTDAVTYFSTTHCRRKEWGGWVVQRLISLTTSKKFRCFHQHSNEIIVIKFCFW